MKAIKVDTKSVYSVVDVEEPVYQGIGKLLGGTTEHVRPRRLEQPYCMMVDDEGLCKGLPANLVGSWLYAADMQGGPIVGDVYIMREKTSCGSYDVVGLTDTDIPVLLANLKTIVGRITRGWAT